LLSKVAEWTRAEVDEALGVASRCLCQLSLAGRECFVYSLSSLVPAASSASSCRRYLGKGGISSCAPAFPAISSTSVSSLSSSSIDTACVPEEGDGQSSKTTAPASRKNLVSRNAGKIYHATRSALTQSGSGSAALLLQDEEKINPLGDDSEIHFTHEAFCNYCEVGSRDCPYDTAQLAYVLLLAQLLHCNRHHKYDALSLFFSAPAYVRSPAH
jgi:hypothetical protein